MALSSFSQQLFTGLALTLCLASGTARLIKWRVAGGRPHAVIDNLNARINAWWVMVGVLAFSFWFERFGLLLLFAAISALALREYARVAGLQAQDGRLLRYLCWLFLPVQYGLIAIDWYGLYAIFIPVYAFLVLPMLATQCGDTRNFLARCACAQWGLMACVYCLSHVPALQTLAIPGWSGSGLQLVAFLLLVAQGSDVLQYIWGKLLGRTPVAPQLSPSKTVEGLLGGVASATLLGAALHPITPFSPLQAAALAFTICVMGFLGGLVMSAIKRGAGVKDWGQLIEGHGGLLDRLDSVAFAAPVFFHFVRYGWT
ncbi:MAG: phosphatidate cytidylyltransferase [Inhella sp.]